MSGAFLEPIVFVLRVPRPGTEGTMPLDYAESGTCMLSAGVMTIQGYVHPHHTETIREDIIAACGRAGASEVFWERKKGGVWVPLRVRVPDPGPKIYI